MISFLTSSGVSSRNSTKELKQVSLKFTDSTGGSTESMSLRIVSIFLLKVVCEAVSKFSRRFIGWKSALQIGITKLVNNPE